MKKNKTGKKSGKKYTPPKITDTFSENQLLKNIVGHQREWDIYSPPTDGPWNVSSR